MMAANKIFREVEAERHILRKERERDSENEGVINSVDTHDDTKTMRSLILGVSSSRDASCLF
jgi:hypothetical protein